MDRNEKKTDPVTINGMRVDISGTESQLQTITPGVEYSFQCTQPSNQWQELADIIDDAGKDDGDTGSDVRIRHVVCVGTSCAGGGGESAAGSCCCLCRQRDSHVTPLSDSDFAGTLSSSLSLVPLIPICPLRHFASHLTPHTVL